MAIKLGSGLGGFLEYLTGEEESRETRWFWLAFVSIVLAGMIMRLWNLSGAPIWMDEAVTLAFARLPLPTILFNAIDNHPPLTFAIQHVWQALVPDPAYARVPVATAGILGLIAIMLCARDQISPRGALMAGLLFAFSTSHIYYSQDARMYPYLMLGLSLAAWGGIGHVRANLHRPKTYRALYIIGGTIAIYSHMLGLIAMALIGFASLAAGMMSKDRTAFMRAWFINNGILFVITLPWLIQIPAAVATFPGMSGTNSLIDIQWFYRNVTGFPGLNNLAVPFELLLYIAAAASAPIAWLSNRRGLALVLAGLIVVFPLVILGLHIRQPMMANKVLLPSVIGVTLGAAYTLAVIRPKLIGVGLAAILAAAALGSAFTEITHRVKPGDYPGAFTYADQQGYRDTPVLTCIHFTSAAVWEARTDATILYHRAGDILHYKGPEYWQTASKSMSWLRAASAADIDVELGGGWLIEGGLAGALEHETRLVFMRPACPNDNEQLILNELTSLGFELAHETQIRGNATDFIILNDPLTRVSLFQRGAENDAVQPD